MRWLAGLVFCAVSMLTGTSWGGTDLYDTDATLRPMEKVWDKSADFSGVSDWEAYLTEYAQRVRSPLKVTLSQE